MRPIILIITYSHESGVVRHQLWLIVDRLLPLTPAEAQYSMASGAGKAGARDKLTQQNHPMIRGNGYNHPTNVWLARDHPGGL